MLRSSLRFFVAPLFVLLPLALAPACGDDAADGDEDGDGDGDGDGEGAGTGAGGDDVPFVPATSFDAAPITWGTPDGGYSEVGFITVSGGDYDPGEHYFATMDLTGDGLPDLVLSAESGSQYGAPGGRHWLVHENTGAGFAADALVWSTPDGGYSEVGFITTAGGDYDPGEHYFATVDMTGDEKPDLVLSAQSGSQYGSPGGRHWLVYENTGSGFATDPIVWSTPDGGYTEVGFLTLGGGDYDPGEHYFATMDMTGDKKPDLVLSAQSGSQYGSPGGRHWLVYENTGSGFATDPIVWSTPDGGYTEVGFLTTAGGDYDPGENYFATLDMTGDEKPDLVLSAESGSQYGSPGGRHWLVYENTGSGFAADPITWTTPNGGYTEVGFLTTAGGDYDPGENYFATMDMTGDKKPDLVVSALSGSQYGEPGTRHWLVHENTGTGFAAEGPVWSTPDGGYSEIGFITVAGGDYDPGENYFATMDMTGDEKPDLVISADAGEQLGGPGARHWLVYPAIP